MDTILEVDEPLRAVDAPVAGVRLCRLFGNADYAHELRLNDGFVDALETFWIGGDPALTIVAPDEIVMRLRADMFRTPRVAPVVVGVSEVMGWAGAAALAETDPIARRFYGYLGLAARDPSAATLILGSDIFPIRDVSPAGLLERAVAPAVDAEKYGVGWPIGLFHGGAAADWLAKPDAFGHHLVSRRRRAVLDALGGLELVFWATRDDEPLPPVFKTMPDAKWRRIAAEGWERQPWKGPDDPHFLCLAGAAEDAEAALRVVYGTLHR